jgi:hypothetical protein
MVRRENEEARKENETTFTKAKIVAKRIQLQSNKCHKLCE